LVVLGASAGYRANHIFKAIDDCVFDPKSQKSNAVVLTEAALRRHYEELKEALTFFTLHGDESTDASNKGNSLYVDTCIQKIGKFASSFFDEEDVSVKGSSTGEAIFQSLFDGLSAKELLKYFDGIVYDGCSNVNPYKNQKGDSSGAKWLQWAKENNKHFFVIWCLNHRLNLSLNDALEFLGFNKSVVPLVSACGSLLRSSSQNQDAMEAIIKETNLDKKEVKPMLKQWEATCDLATKVVGRTEDELAIMVENDNELRGIMDVLLEERQAEEGAEEDKEEDEEEKEESKEESKEEELDANAKSKDLKKLGKVRTVGTLLTVRWTSFFNCLSNLMKLLPWFTQYLKGQRQIFLKAQESKKPKKVLIFCFLIKQF
jgi:hypothetical protein